MLKKSGTRHLLKGAASRNRKSGSALVEFALVGTFLFIPILAGLVSVGISLVVSQQVANLTSNAGQMFAAGVDFTQAANQALLERLSGNLLTGSSYGVVILSEIDGNATTPNLCSGQVVVPQGSTAGTSQYCSAVGSSASGAFSALNLGLSTDSSGNSVSSGTLQVGQRSFIAETFYNNPMYAWALAPTGTGSGIYNFAAF